MTSYGDEHSGRADGTGSSWNQPRPERRAWPVAPSHTPPAPPTAPADAGSGPGLGALDTPTDALAQLTAADLATARPDTAAAPPAPPALPTSPGSPAAAAQPAVPATAQPAGTAMPTEPFAPTEPPAPAQHAAPARPATAPPLAAGPTSPAPYPTSAPPVPVQASAPPVPVPYPTSAPPVAVPVAPAGRGRAGWLALAAAVTVVLLVGVFVIVKVAGSGGGAPTRVAAGGPGPSGGAGSAASGTSGEQAAGGTSGSPSAVPSRGGASPTAANPTRTAAKPATGGTISDDFTSGLNTSMWDVYGTSSSSTYNSTMVRVTGGELQVLGVGNSPTASANKSGGLCWCGTSGNHVYGKWQVRARFDAGSGYRQVIELWPQSDSDTTDGSINFAGDSDAAKQNLDMSVLQPGGGRDWSGNVPGDFTAWHTFTVEWRANSVKMYVDSAKVYDSATSGTPLTVPSKPMHLVIQQDKGPANGIPAANSSTPAQVVMHVDWVRFSP